MFLRKNKKDPFNDGIIQLTPNYYLSHWYCFVTFIEKYSTFQIPLPFLHYHLVRVLLKMKSSVPKLVFHILSWNFACKYFSEVLFASHPTRVEQHADILYCGCSELCLFPNSYFVSSAWLLSTVHIQLVHPASITWITSYFTYVTTPYHLIPFPSLRSRFWTYILWYFIGNNDYWHRWTIITLGFCVIIS